jgi:hypothetical protein
MTSTEIAELLGRDPRHVRKILQKYDLPRLRDGARYGEHNHQFATGRRITLNGYVLVTAPADHPHAKCRPGRQARHMFEHRLAMEQHLGRLLAPTERVDHIDGLTLHNHPSNLRVFDCNAEHLRQTLTGKTPRWSDAGHQNMFLRHRQPEALQRVDTHRQRTEAGATRLRQILLAALKLGTDSPYLLGSQRWLEQAGIALTDRPTIERALDDLCLRWGWGRAL